MSVDIYDYDCEQSCSMLKSLRKKLETVKVWINEVPDPPSLYLSSIPYWEEIYTKFVDAYNASLKNVQASLEAEREVGS